MKLLLLPWLGLATLLAIAPPARAGVQVQSELPGVSGTLEWKWLSNALKFPEYFAVVTVNLPTGAQLDRAAAVNGGRIVGRTPGVLKLVVTGLHEVVRDVSSGGQSGSVRIDIDGKDKPSAEWNCKNLDLDLVPQPGVPADVYAGISCVKTKPDQVSIYISVPREVEWGNTTLFEDAGKGERWHQFTLLKYERGISEKEQGTFNFSLNGASFSYKLVQRKNAAMVAAQNETAAKAQQLTQDKRKLEKENKKLQDQVKYLATQKAQTEEPMVSFKGGIGIAKLGMTTEAGSPSSMQPLVFFGANTKPLVIGLLVGCQVKYAIPIGESSQAFYDIFVHTGPRFKLGESSELSPSIGLVSMGQDFDPDGVSFRHTNTALGINLRISAVWIDLLVSGMVPAGDSKYMSLGLGFAPSYKERVYVSFGGYYQKTSYDLVTSSFDQILGAVFLHF